MKNLKFLAGKISVLWRQFLQLCSRKVVHHSLYACQIRPYSPQKSEGVEDSVCDFGPTIKSDADQVHVHIFNPEGKVVEVHRMESYYKFTTLLTRAEYETLCLKMRRSPLNNCHSYVPLRCCVGLGIFSSYSSKVKTLL